MDLLVVRPFGVYRAGDRISDQATIAAVLATEHAARVVRVPPVTVIAAAAKKEG